MTLIASALILDGRGQNDPNAFRISGRCSGFTAMAWRCLSAIARLGIGDCRIRHAVSELVT
jgi:hypothetical protein